MLELIRGQNSAIAVSCCMSLPTEDGVNDVQSGLCFTLLRCSTPVSCLLSPVSCFLFPVVVLLFLVVVPCCSSFERNVFSVVVLLGCIINYWLHLPVLGFPTRLYAGYFQLFVQAIPRYGHS